MQKGSILNYKRETFQHADLASKCLKFHIRELLFKAFSGGRFPWTPLRGPPWTVRTSERPTLKSCIRPRNPVLFRDHYLQIVLRMVCCCRSNFTETLSRYLGWCQALRCQSRLQTPHVFGQRWPNARRLELDPEFYPELPISWCWPNGSRSLGTRLLRTLQRKWKKNYWYVFFDQEKESPLVFSCFDPTGSKYIFRTSALSKHEHFYVLLSAMILFF